MCQPEEAHLYMMINSHISPCGFCKIVYTYPEMQKQVFGVITKVQKTLFSLWTHDV